MCSLIGGLMQVMGLMLLLADAMKMPKKSEIRPTAPNSTLNTSFTPYLSFMCANVNKGVVALLISRTWLVNKYQQSVYKQFKSQ